MNSCDSDVIVRKAKVILLGNSGVGKTSLISAIRQCPYNPVHQATVGIDFFSKLVETNGALVKLQFWDTAGQQRFRCIIPSYLRSARIGVIVYDVSQLMSQQSLANWIQTFEEYAPQFAKIIIVANKIDISNRQNTELTQITDQLKRMNLVINYVSAKTHSGIPDLIQKIANIVVQNDIGEYSSATTNINKREKVVIEDGDNLKEYGCCRK